MRCFSFKEQVKKGEKILILEEAECIADQWDVYSHHRSDSAGVFPAPSHFLLTAELQLWDQQDGSFPSNSSFPVFSESLGRKKISEASME